MSTTSFQTRKELLIKSIQAERKHEAFLISARIDGQKLEASRKRLTDRCYAYNELCLRNPDRGLDKTEV